MKILYFAWVRERIGKTDEDIEPAGECEHGRRSGGVAVERGDEYAYAFENPKVIRAAIDRSHVHRDTRLAGAREIAFFPPMTGG